MAFAASFTRIKKFFPAFNLQPKGSEGDCQAVMNLPIRIENGRADGTQTVHDPFATAKRDSAFLDPRQFQQ